MKNSETCHFWAGHFPSVEALSALFVETYSEDDAVPISPFAATQNETFYDHDFLEYGFSDSARSIKELVDGYSYSDQWLAEFEEKIASLGLTNVNAFVFLTAEEIEDPQSIENNDSEYLRYLGTISYRI